MAISYHKNTNAVEQSDEIQRLDKLLCPLVRKWFFSQFEAYSQSQLSAVSLIHSRMNTLVSAPTGSTKTLTAFLAILNELVQLAQKQQLEEKVYAIYISPLKALNYDIEYNLQKPLEQIEALWTESPESPESPKNTPLNIKVLARTGDTTPYQRSKMLEHPPHILVTTPESLAILLASERFRVHLKDTNWVIIDEIHAIADNKRGTLLSLHLEQLQQLAPSICRVGLSATAAPLESIAQFLVGNESGGTDDAMCARDCTIVKIENNKQLDLKVLSPVKNLIESGWQEISKAQLELIHEHIQSHKSTLVFTNTRAATERIVFALKDAYPNAYYEINEEPPFERSQLIGAHHGSLSPAHRKDMETRLREGKMKCIVCSTSLELGIDIGYVDLVLLLGSPKGVSRLLQRVGRSGHKLHATPKGRIIATDRDELLESIVLVDLAKRGIIDAITIPENCLDVLCQFIIGMSIHCKYTTDELFAIVTSAYPYRTLAREQFDKCLDYLSTDYDLLIKMRIYPKITIQSVNNIGNVVCMQSRTVKEIYLTNAGTISDSGDIAVKRGQQYLGSIDEGFMELLKPSDIFVLGGETYKFVRMQGMTAQVVDAYGRSPTVPRWKSQALSLSSDAAKAVNTARNELLQLVSKAENKSEKTTNELPDIQRIAAERAAYFGCDVSVALQLVNYADLQHRFVGDITSKQILVEYFNDGPIHMTLVHTLVGRKINEALAYLFSFGARRLHKKDFQSIVTDTGFALVGEKMVDLQSIMRGIQVGNTREILSLSLDASELVKRRFRSCAVRGFMILRRFRGHEKRVGKQQFNSTILFSTVRSIDPDFIIFHEAKREALDDVTDTNGAQKIVDRLLKGELSFAFKTLGAPSPFGIMIASAQFSDVLSPSERHAYGRNLEMMIQALAAQKPLVGKKRAQGVLNQQPQSPTGGAINATINTSFSYKDYWKKENDSQRDQTDIDDEKERADALQKQKNSNSLAVQLKRVAMKVNLDSQLHYELSRLIDGESGGYSPQFATWLKGMFVGAIPKVWSDELVNNIKTRAREERLL